MSELSDACKQKLVKDITEAMDESNKLNGKGKYKNVGPGPETNIRYMGHDKDITKWFGVLIGPEKSVYRGMAFPFVITVTQNYPDEPPKAAFIGSGSPWHSNVREGSICLTALHSTGQGSWKPTNTMRSFVTLLQFLLVTPNPNSPLNGTANSQWTVIKDSKNNWNIVKVSEFRKKAVENFINDLLDSHADTIGSYAYCIPRFRQFLAQPILDAYNEYRKNGRREAAAEKIRDYLNNME